MAAKLNATARHEAGHAALAIRLGRTVTRLAIEDDHSGVCEAAPPAYARTGPNRRRAMREDLLIALAGDVAERQPGYVSRWWRL